MPGDVAGKLTATAVPTAVAFLRLGLKTRVCPQVIEHAVRFQFKQIVSVQILSTLERTTREADSG